VPAIVRPSLHDAEAIDRLQHELEEEDNERECSTAA
jgi:hypothetical protein